MVALGKFLDKNVLNGGTTALVRLACIQLLARMLKRLIVCVLARWSRTWSWVCQGSLFDCKSMVLGAALNATIRLPIL
jgi:hypothetical protein